MLCVFRAVRSIPSPLRLVPMWTLIGPTQNAQPRCTLAEACAGTAAPLLTQTVYVNQTVRVRVVFDARLSSFRLVCVSLTWCPWDAWFVTTVLHAACQLALSPQKY